MGIKGFFSLLAVLSSGVTGLLGLIAYNCLSFVEIQTPNIAPLVQSVSQIGLELPLISFKLDDNTSAADVSKPSPPVELTTKKVVVIQKAKIKKSKAPRLAKRVYLNIQAPAPIGAIDDSELVAHHGFNVPPIKVTNLSVYLETVGVERILAKLDKEHSPAPATSVAVAGFENDEKDLSDIVKSVKSSRQKKTDAMIFLDYSKGPAQKIIAQATSPPKVSKSVLKAIERESKKRSRKEERPRSVATPPPPVFFPPPALIPRDSKQTTLRAYTAVMDKGLDNQNFNFQFVPDYDKSAAFSSNDDGIATIQTGKFEKGVMRGRVVSRGHMVTVVNLPVDSHGREIELPLMDEETFNAHLEKIAAQENFNVNDIYGGFALVEMSDEVEDVSVDREYVSRIFLNENFKQVSRKTGHSFVLFLGVKPGNAIISYLLKNGQVAEKIAHIPLNEIYYDLGKVEKSSYETIELYQRNMFAAEKQELSLDVKQIGYFNRNVKFVAKTPNRYEFKRPALPVGMRKYLKLDHLGATIYAGYGENPKLELPERGFIESIMGEFGLDDLGNVCVVQVNLPKVPVSLELDLNSRHQPGTINTIYLDSDGLFGATPSLKTRKAFIVGDAEGVFTGKIKYADSGIKVFNSFCSIETWLVEQL